MTFKEPVTLLPGRINRQLVRRSLWKYGGRWSQVVALSATILDLWERTKNPRAVRLLLFWALGDQRAEAARARSRR